MAVAVHAIAGMSEGVPGTPLCVVFQEISGSEGKPSGKPQLCTQHSATYAVIHQFKGAGAQGVYVADDDIGIGGRQGRC